ncbi:hypothetical protein EDB81DRAFT_501654 [Dactylonectria macrodidyma]|uniref:Uncharacterized protein n=1 Tax=Dactylonectria macrodidyma TaxID=307937 RepID=A0A9P9ETJ3_9HYPO|nr:hypothetical protein EDB81DRAFT_501654 [Dactylonectria macrodidyma]
MRSSAWFLAFMDDAYLACLVIVGNAVRKGPLAKISYLRRTTYLPFVLRMRVAVSAMDDLSNSRVTRLQFQLIALSDVVYLDMALPAFR